MVRDFGQYKWSIRTLDRRLRYFKIYYIDKGISLQDAREILADDFDGPGKLLGHRAMHLKLNQKHDIKLPRDLVYDLMTEADPEGLEQRRLKKKNERQLFITKGPNGVFSVDGHDKLMGYQNSTFPIAIYGCIDTARKKFYG